MGRYAQTCPIIYGAGTVSLLGEEVRKLGCSKVMVVSDNIVAGLPTYAKCKTSLLTAGLEIVEFTEIIPDPPDYVINRGGELARTEKIDGIIAIGGGSPMDAAKGITVLINNPGTVNQYFGNPCYVPGVPVVMVVTTAGTGSESTSVGVITDTENNVKNSVICNAALGILDPEATVTAPPELTAYTGMDTLAHAAEAITAKIPNPKSELLAAAAIKKVVANLPLAVADGQNIAARGELLLASNFAGIAFNDALVHLGHAIAHAAGAAFHITHGLVCALALPEVMKYAADSNSQKVKVVGEAMGIRFSGQESPQEVGELVARGIRNFAEQLQIKSFAALGIARKELLAVTPLVFNDACYQFVPKELTNAEVESLLGNMYDNYK